MLTEAKLSLPNNDTGARKDNAPKTLAEVLPPRSEKYPGHMKRWAEGVDVLGEALQLSVELRQAIFIFAAVLKEGGKPDWRDNVSVKTGYPKDFVRRSIFRFLAPENEHLDALLDRVLRYKPSQSSIDVAPVILTAKDYAEIVNQLDAGATYEEMHTKYGSSIPTLYSGVSKYRRKDRVLVSE